MRWSGIVLHHSLTKDGETVNWNAIVRYHTKDKGWSDVGYAFGIEKVGEEYRIYEGRPLDRKGAHVKELDFNAKYIGICIVGNYDKGPVPMEAWSLAQSLVEVLQEKFDIPTQRVIGHREAQAFAGVLPDYRKSCPGAKFNLVAFRRGLFDGKAFSNKN